MILLSNLLALFSCMAPLWPYALNYVFCLAFLAVVPCFIRALFEGR